MRTGRQDVVNDGNGAWSGISDILIDGIKISKFFDGNPISLWGFVRCIGRLGLKDQQPHIRRRLRYPVTDAHHPVVVIRVINNLRSWNGYQSRLCQPLRVKCLRKIARACSNSTFLVLIVLLPTLAGLLFEIAYPAVRAAELVIVSRSIFVEKITNVVGGQMKMIAPVTVIDFGESNGVIQAQSICRRESVPGWRLRLRTVRAM